MCDCSKTKQKKTFKSAWNVWDWHTFPCKMAYQMQVWLVVHWIGLAYVSREYITQAQFILKITMSNLLLIVYVYLTGWPLSLNLWLDPLLSFLLYVDQLQSCMQTVPWVTGSQFILRVLLTHMYYYNNNTLCIITCKYTLSQTRIISMCS